mmetsp:Transcript_16144/g.36322  ORF Transcript_16144/g.36322 Transcript_16144/m.36322 type:complete len:244 (-) Transcript_16144:374-1105(-)
MPQITLPPSRPRRTPHVASPAAVRRRPELALSAPSPGLVSHQRQHDVAGQAPQLPHAVHPLVRPGLDVHLARRRPQQPHDVLLHGRLEIRHLGPLQDQRHVHVADPIAVPLHHLAAVLHEFRRVATPPAGISVLEDLADVGEGQGAEDGVDDAVVDDVAVGVGDDAELGHVDRSRGAVFSFGVGPLLVRMRNGHASDNHRLTGIRDGSHSMNVEPVSNSHRQRFHFVRNDGRICYRIVGGSGG